MSIEKVSKGSYKITTDLVRRANDRMIKGGTANKYATITNEGICVKVTGRVVAKNIIITKEKINTAYKQARLNAETV